MKREKMKRVKKLKILLSSMIALFTLLGAGVGLSKTDALNAKPKSVTRAYPSARFEVVNYEISTTLQPGFNCNVEATGKVSGSPYGNAVFFQTNTVPLIAGTIAHKNIAYNGIRKDGTFRVLADTRNSKGYNQPDQDYLFVFDNDSVLLNGADEYRYYSNGRIYTDNTSTPKPFEFYTQPGPQNPVVVSEITKNSAKIDFKSLISLRNNAVDSGLGYGIQYRNMLLDPHSSETGEIYWKIASLQHYDPSTDEIDTAVDQLLPGNWYETRWNGEVSWPANPENQDGYVRLPTASTKFVTLLDFANLNAVADSKNSAKISGKVIGYHWQDNGVQVEYRKKGDTAWIDGKKTTDTTSQKVNAGTDTANQESTFEITQDGLAVATTYEYRVKSSNYNELWNGAGVVCYSEVGEFTTQEDEPWLPYYKPNTAGGWLDTEKNVIPKENAFVMQYMEGDKGTKPVAKSEDIKYDKLGREPFDLKISPDYLELPFNGKRQWMAFENVGFYNGRNVGVLVSVQADAIPALPSVPPLNTFDVGSIGWRGDKFLDIVIPHYHKGVVDVSFEFFDASKSVPSTGILTEDMKIKVSGYWTYNGVSGAKKLEIPTTFKNIYSVSREYSDPIDLKWTESEDKQYLSIQGDDPAGGLQRSYQKFTITYDELSEIRYAVQTTLEVPNRLYGIYYTQETDVKVEIPDPQDGGTQHFRELIQKPGSTATQGIVDEDIRNLNYSFIQQIPWESSKLLNNRNQKINWNITEPAGSNVLTSVNSENKGWECVALDENKDRTSWFDFSSIENIFPSSAADYHSSESSFYNHYYNFVHQLQVDYKEKVEMDSLTEAIINGESKKAILDLASGSAKLNVTDDNPPTGGMIPGKKEYGGKANFQTTINFYAPLTYKYVDKATGKEIPQSVLTAASAPATGDGYVTHDATPEVIPSLAGYAYDHTELNGKADDLQIKVTKLYDEGSLVDPNDPNDAASYTKNNIVTLYYQAVNYDVDIVVVGPTGNVVAAAKPHFEVQVVGSDEWVDLNGGFAFDAIGTQYQIRQKEAVSEFYEPTEQASPIFSMTVDQDGVYQFTGDDDEIYSFEWDADEKKLTIKVVNEPKGDVTLLDVDKLEYGTVDLPQKEPNAPIQRQNEDWKVNYTDTRPDGYRTNVQLKVTMTQDFTSASGKEARGILAFINEPGTITEQDFLVLNSEMPLTNQLNPTYGDNAFSWDSKAGFLLQIDKDKETKIFKGNYEAELTFILAEDPL